MTKLISFAILLFVEAALGAQVRNGTVAERLSDDDVAEIRKLATAVGKRVWLLEGTVSRIPPWTRFVNAFLEPDSNAGTVQRGRVLRVQSEGVTAKPVKWQQTSISSYAKFGSERPIELGGSFSDDELIGLLAYIRTSPSPASQTNGEGVDGTLPVTAVRQDGNEVIVGLRRSDVSGQAVWLVRERGEWVAVRVHNWVL